MELPVIAALLSLLLPVSSVCLAAPQYKAPAQEGFRNAAKNVSYVGSRACAGCHAQIYESYERTDMGGSMSVVTGAKLGMFPASVTIRSEQLNRNYSVSRERDGIYESEYEVDSSGAEVFRNTQKLEYAIGSGANATTFLVRRGDYLFEAPLTYYARIQKWRLSPGYETEDIGFSRTIPAACVACHSGQPRPVSKSRGLFQNPPFQELAIGCENCHGPGQLHVSEHGRGKTLRGKADRSIVNPAKLPGWLADEICMNCHQGAATRILQPGKEFADFRPGTPLNATVAIFAPPLRRGATERSPLLEHHMLMTWSKCYRASNGKMGCLTCHDPHVQPRTESAAYFRKKCLSCHSEADCKLSLNARAASTPADDCAGCHMPKESATIPHSVLTNHRIVTRNDEPLPEEAYGPTGSAQPELVHIDAVPGTKDAIPPLTLLRAYGEMSLSDPQFAGLYLEALDRAAQTDPDEPSVLSGLGWREVSRNTVEAKGKATDYLRRAIQKGSRAPLDFEKLAELLGESGKHIEAIAILRQGINDNPYSARLYKAIATIYIAEKRYDDALRAMRRELELFPEDSFMRGLLLKAETAHRP